MILIALEHVMKKLHKEKSGSRIHTLGNFHFYMAKRKLSVAVVDTIFICDSAEKFQEAGHN
jgi:hypothetical protein